MEKQCVLWTNHNNNYLQIIVKNFVSCIHAKPNFLFMGK